MGAALQSAIEPELKAGDFTPEVCARVNDSDTA